MIENMRGRSTETKYGRIPLWLYETGVGLQAIATYGWLHGRYGHYERVMPSYKTLAKELGVSKGSAVAYVKALASVGALRVEVSGAAAQRPNEYVIAFNEPFKVEERQDEGDQHADRVSQLTHGGQPADRRGQPVGHEEDVLKKTKEQTDAPSARSALDAVGQTSGSGNPSTGGSAAADKTQPPRSRDDWAAIHAVREELGRTIPDLNTALGEATPPPLDDAILTGLAAGTPAERTPQQLIRHRVLPRWNGYWAARYYAGELREQPIGPAISMLTADRSDHDRCDERVNVDTGAPCTPCTMRAEDRRHTRRQDRQEARQRPGEATPAAPVPGPRTPPTPKRAEPEAALVSDTELAARLAQATRAATAAGQDDRDTCPGDDGKPCGRPTSRGRCWRHLAAAVSAGA